MTRSSANRRNSTARAFAAKITPEEARKFVRKNGAFFDEATRKFFMFIPDSDRREVNWAYAAELLNRSAAVAQ